MSTNSNEPRYGWQPAPHPEWVERINAEGRMMDIEGIVPLDADNLIATAVRATGLSDFGEPGWEEPFRVLTRALDAEAGLTLMGRIMTRSDLLVFLQNRLRIEEEYRRHPEIEDEVVRAPVFICGLPRSGTTILFELLAQDPAFLVPETWALFFSTPPCAMQPAADDPRPARTHALVTQWNRVAPEYAAMHEMGGRIPSECGMIMANCFVSDHYAALHATPSYDAYLYSGDWDMAYRYHRRLLKLLQWKGAPRRWLLKAPNHLGHLPRLLAAYPDAHIVQTHRDPIRCMASATNLLGTLYWMRSDRPFDSTAFEDLIMGSATAQRLENVMDQRDAGLIPAAQISDSRYADLMSDPVGAVERIYARIGMEFSAASAARIRDYLASKPKHKFGVHQYAVDESPQLGRDRALFARYRQRHQVQDES